MKDLFSQLGFSSIHLVKYACQVIILGATLAGTILLFYDFIISFFQSPDLVVQELTIEGNDRIDQNEIRALVQISQGTNIWLVNLDKIAKRLESHPWVRACGVQRIPPQRIHIKIEERKAIVFCLNPEDSMMYGIDAEGAILPPLMGESLIKKPAEEQEKEIQLVLSCPLLRGIEMPFEPGKRIDQPEILNSIRFLDRLKKETPKLFSEIVESEWRKDGTFALHPKRRIGVIVMKDFASQDIEKKMKALWEVMEEQNVHAIYVDARFPEKGFAVRFEENENGSWQKLYQNNKSLLTTAGRAEL